MWPAFQRSWTFQKGPLGQNCRRSTRDQRRSIDVLCKSSLVLRRSTDVLCKSSLVLRRSTDVLCKSSLVLRRSTDVLRKSNLVLRRSTDEVRPASKAIARTRIVQGRASDALSMARSDPPIAHDISLVSSGDLSLPLPDYAVRVQPGAARENIGQRDSLVDNRRLGAESSPAR
jgi:hypothetical protein